MATASLENLASLLRFSSTEVKGWIWMYLGAQEEPDSELGRVRRTLNYAGLCLLTGNDAASPNSTVQIKAMTEDMARVLRNSPHLGLSSDYVRNQFMQMSEPLYNLESEKYGLLHVSRSTLNIIVYEEVNEC
jgi:hypothetical protein